MFTTQFKVTLAVLVAFVVFGALLVNQLTLQNRVAALENQQATKALVQITPTATPSATLSPTTSVKVLLRTVATPTAIQRVSTPSK